VIAVTWWRPPMFSIATISNRARARSISPAHDFRV
jgi:hypothetical protein